MKQIFRVLLPDAPNIPFFKAFHLAKLKSYQSHFVIFERCASSRSFIIKRINHIFAPYNRISVCSVSKFKLLRNTWPCTATKYRSSGTSVNMIQTCPFCGSKLLDNLFYHIKNAINTD